MFRIIFTLAILVAQGAAFRPILNTIRRVSSVGQLHAAPYNGPLGGKVVVSGIGKVDEDEFLLTLLNDQVYLSTNIRIF
jgi:hypothetical protein